jgi:hypothetical protein
MSNSVFFSEDDKGADAHFQAACDKAFKAHADAHFQAHVDAALQADPDNDLLREAILIGLSLQ